MTTAAEVLKRAAALGITFRPDGDLLCYRPTSAVPPRPYPGREAQRPRTWKPRAF